MKYTLNYTLNNGEVINDIYSDDIRDIRNKAESLIYSDRDDGTYVTNANVMIGCSSYDKIWSAERVKGTIIESFNEAELFFRVLEDMNFRLDKFHDGFGITEEIPNQKDSEVTTKRFDSASDLIDNIERTLYDTYNQMLNDSLNDIKENSRFFSRIESITSDERPVTPSEWIDYMDRNPFFKQENAFEYDVMKLLDMPFDEIDKAIDLENVPHIGIDDVDWNKDSPHYVITSYYGNDFRGVEDDYQSYDWRKIEEEAHEKLMKGSSVIIEDDRYGGSLEIKADDYIMEWDNDLGEFPYKPDDLRKERSQEMEL